MVREKGYLMCVAIGLSKSTVGVSFTWFGCLFPHCFLQIWLGHHYLGVSMRLQIEYIFIIKYQILKTLSSIFYIFFQNKNMLSKFCDAKIDRICNIAFKITFRGIFQNTFPGVYTDLLLLHYWGIYKHKDSSN